MKLAELIAWYEIHGDRAKDELADAELHHLPQSIIEDLRKTIARYAATKAELCKLDVAAQREMDLTRAWNAKLYDYGEKVKTLESRLDEQTKIVARIWEVLGSPDYDDLKGRSIYEVIQGWIDLALERERRLHTGELSRDLDHGCGTIGKGCKYETVEAMLKSRLRSARVAQARLRNVIGWREHDWPEWFDRRTAEAVAELASPSSEVVEQRLLTEELRDVLGDALKESAVETPAPNSETCPRDGCPYVGGPDFNIGNPCRCG